MKQVTKARAISLWKAGVRIWSTKPTMKNKITGQHEEWIECNPAKVDGRTHIFGTK